MAHITYRCEICSSEILASRRVPTPHVCMLCRLSDNEAFDMLEEDEAGSQRGYRGQRTVSSEQFGLRLA